VPWLYAYFQPVNLINLTKSELDLVRRLARISDHVYNPTNNEVWKEINEPKCLNIRGGEQLEKRIKWLVLEFSEYFIIGIQGTDNLMNLRSDVKFDLDKNIDLDIKVHSGFNSAALAIYTQIHRENPDVFSEGRKLIFTGHSLGGAVALIMAMKAKKIGLDVRAVTFGQPEITNKEGAILYGGFPVLRVVIHNDPITDISKRVLSFLSRRHFGTILILTRDSKYLMIYKELSDPNRASDKTIVRKNHEMKYYISKLQSIQPRAQLSYWERVRLVYKILRPEKRSIQYWD
jgi:predicted lipase